MSYAEDRADSRSLTAVTLLLLGVAVIALVLYFAWWGPSRAATDTVIVQPGASAPAPAPPSTNTIIVPGAQGPAGAPGAPGAPGNSGPAGEPGTPPPTTTGG